jgi:dTMP kinase
MRLSNRPAAFITFEGIDGSGKSTQLRMLASELRLLGLDVVTTREPGGTPLGTRIRELLLDTNEQVDPLTELLLYASDRAQHVKSLIRPALEAGHLVLSDRYADATVAYQGGGRGFPTNTIEEIVKLATDGLKPDLTLLFDLPLAESKKRTRGRDGKPLDRLESEDEMFLYRVRNSYLKIANSEPERVRIIDSSGSVRETHSQVLSIVTEFLKTKNNA